MLKAGIVGVGFMGWIHYLAYQRSKAVELTAFASRDAKKRAGDWTSIRGNFGPPGEQIDVSGLSTYENYESMLADDSIDLIDVCLPPNLHVEACKKALAAGKHVLCEKPLGLTTGECDEILGAAKTAGRQVFVAQVLPFMGEFQFAYEAAAEGRFGAARRAHLKRVISPPDWIPDFYDPTTVGGPLIDLHVHDTHFIRLLFGMPKRVIASAQMQDGVVRFCSTLMEFDDPELVVSTISGVSSQTARPFCHGYEIEFEKAAMQFELSALGDGVASLPLQLLPVGEAASQPALEESDEVDAFRGEIDEAAAAIASGSPAPRLDGMLARDAIHICHCLTESARTGGWVECR